MADAPAERGTARQPSNRGREDTVALQIPAPPETHANGTNGSHGSSPNGSSKVLPPMPATKPPSKPPKAAAKPAAAAPAQAPSQAPGPKPATPPPQASRSAAAPAAAAAAVTAAVTTPAPASAPPKPTVKAPQPVKAPKPAKPAKQPKAPKAKKPAAVVKESRPTGRRARLRMTRVDPWSVMKTSFLLSIALGIVTVVSVLMVWSVLDAADVWSSINETVQGVVGGQEASNFNIEDYVGTRRVVGFTMIVAAVDVILLTAIATLGAFLYNMSASLLGGIEVTLAEDN